MSVFARPLARSLSGSAPARLISDVKLAPSRTKKLLAGAFGLLAAAVLLISAVAAGAAGKGEDAAFAAGGPEGSTPAAGWALSGARPRANAILAGASNAVAGSTYVVNSTADTDDGSCTTEAGGCTLREAVAAANADAGADTISFDAALRDQTIRLAVVGDGTAGPSALSISSAVVIEGLTGRGGVTIARAAGATNMRLFIVTGTGSLTLRDVTLRGGLARGYNGAFSGGGSGGGAAGLGGAIFNFGGAVVIDRSTLAGNTAQGGNGGGLGNGVFATGGGGLGGDGGNGPGGGAGGGPNGGAPGGTAPGGVGGAGGFGGGGGGSISNAGAGGFGGGGGGSQNNGGAGGFGGGGGGGDVRSGNCCPGAGGFGGGDGGSGSGSSFGGAGGGGAGLGGAVFSLGGTVSLTSSTLSENTARGGNGASGFGGGVFNLNGAVTISSSTLARNSVVGAAADRAGGGALYNLDQDVALQGFGTSAGDASVTIANSILADSFVNGSDGNTATDTSVVNNGGSYAATTTSIVENGPAAANVLNVDPRLKPLEDNGGPTHTLAPLPDSPALDAGTSSEPTAHRVPPRVSNGAVDIGAFERQIAAPDLEDRTFVFTQGAAITGARLVGSDLEGPTITYAVTSGTLPAGVTLNPDGRFSGTPTERTGPAGVTVTVTVTDTERGSDTAQITIVVQPGGSLVVTTTADTVDDTDDLVSLREAITTANTLPSDDTIVIVVSGVIRLGGALPALAANGRLTITSPQTVSVTISGDVDANGAGNAGDVRVFEVAGGANVALDRLTISGGFVSGSGVRGGGILNNGALAVTNTVVSGNRGDDFSTGGGVSNAGTLTITNSTVSANTTHFNGGGIYNQGTLTLANSTLSDNSTGVNGSGGGVFNFGTLIVTNATLANNRTAGSGGGIHNSTNRSLSITGSTFSGNRANSEGGGIFNAGQLSLSNSTLGGNTANSGGGVANVANPFAPAGNATIVNTTISGNQAAFFRAAGGGLSNSGTLSIRNSIVAGNANVLDGTAPNVQGGVTDRGNNILDGSAADAGLDSRGLRDNGGPTQTIALRAGIPAIDGGNNCVLTANGCGDGNAALTTDQRGVARPVDGDGDGTAVVDIGAFEAPPNAAPAAASASPNPAATDEDVPVQITLTATDAATDALTFSITDAPDNGALTGQDAAPSCPISGDTKTCTLAVTYTPAANFNGADSFKFVATDGPANSNEVTVNITVNAVPDLSVSDVSRAEGNAGTTAFTFIVSLDSPAGPGGVTFDYSTADGTATDADDDYEPAGGSGAIPEGRSSTEIAVEVNGDTGQEANETFIVNVTNAAGAGVQDAQGQGTILNDDGAPSAGQIVISEFRLRGPAPSGTPAPGNEQGQLDEFIELYNSTESDFVVVDASPVAAGPAGWAVVSSDDPLTPKYVIPVGTTIPARGHFLVTNALGYSLAAYAAADSVAGPAPASYEADIPDGAGIALYRTGGVATATPADLVDAVGFAPGLPAPLIAAAPAPGFFEGVPLDPPGGVATPAEHSFVRRLNSGVAQDTDNNKNDFVFVSTDGAQYDGAQSTLGAPGPGNTGSPTQRNGRVKASLVEPCAGSHESPNTARDFDATGPNAAHGTFAIRRRFTNVTGAPVTRLRFRVVDITTRNSPGYAPGNTQADLRVLSSEARPSLTVSGVGCAGEGQVEIEGLTLEEVGAAAPSQPLGGGLNSTLSAGTITLESPLDHGDSRNFEFLLGVEQRGSYRFFVNVEALPDAGAPPFGPARTKAGAVKPKAGKGGK
jgi:CSLREA domain-containing protein